MLQIGTLLLAQGIPVIFDATANLRRYRDRAREKIPRFFEVLVECPLEVCEGRDPKGLYRKAREGAVVSLPGTQAIYEPPDHPEFVVRSDRETPGEAARRIAETLTEGSRAPASPPPRTPSGG
jgi:adenylylsulfate kinase-like enzyme